MDRTPLEIPGYYYGNCSKTTLPHVQWLIGLLDKEKATYFKVQSNTAPLNAAYSSRDVKRRKTRDERIAATERDIKIQKKRVKRSKILSSRSSLSGGTLAREHSLTQNTFNYPQIFGQGFYKQGRIPTPFAHPIFMFNERPDLGSAISDTFVGKLS
jgi:hypothetical protein